MNQDSTTQHSHQDAAAASAALPAEAAGHHAEAHTGDIPPSQVFPHLLGELGDHHGFYIFSFKVSNLPYILYDKETGLSIYTSPEKLEADGKYTLHEGHPQRVSDGHHAAWDFSITNFVAFQMLGLVIMFLLFRMAASKYKNNPVAAPRGLQNMLEALVMFIRDEVVRPNLPSLRIADRLTPYFLSLFFFILIMNLLGLVPGGHSATGAIGTTAALAITTFFVVNYTALKEAGIGAWLHHLLGGAPVYLAPIMIPIEIIGLFTKPFALTMRLFANMSAGHIILLSLIGLTFFFKSWGVVPVSVGFSVFIYFLETLVVFLQAYIFTMLSAVFVGLALGDHVHEEEHAH